MKNERKTRTPLIAAHPANGEEQPALPNGNGKPRVSSISADGQFDISNLPEQNPNPVMRFTREGEPLYGNRAAASLLSFSIQESLPAYWRENVTAAFEAGMNREIEIHHEGRTFAALYVPVSEHGYVNVYCREVTEEKKVQDALRESEERLRLATQAADMCIWELDIPNQTYQLGDNFEAVIGFSREYLPEKAGDPNNPTVVHEDRDAVREVLLQVVKDRQTDVPPLRYRIRNPETQVLIWVEVNAKLIYGEDGSPLRMFGMMQNITTRKASEEEREQLLQLEQRQRTNAEKSRRDAEQAKAKAEQELTERRLAESALGTWTATPLSQELRPAWLRYTVAILAAVIATLVRYVLDPLIGEYVQYSTIFGAVAFSVWFGGVGPALLTAIVGYVGISWFVMEGVPILNPETGHLMSLAIFMFSNAVIMFLGDTMRRAQRHAHQSAGVAVERQQQLETRLLEKQRAEEALRVSQEQLTVELRDFKQLQVISSELIQEDNIHALYEQIVESAIVLMRSDMGSMQMLYPEKNELHLLSWRGFHPDAAAFWQVVTTDSGGSCGSAFRTSQRVIVTDVEMSDIIGDQDRQYFRLSGIRSIQSTPLVSRAGELVGMISTHWRDVHQPSERELRLLDILSRQAADLIERKLAEEKLRQQAEILEGANVAIRDLDDHIVSWNRGVEQLYGWTKEETLGKVSHELFQTRFPVSFEDYKTKLLADGEWKGELEHLKRDGTRLIVLSHQVLYRDMTGNPVAILEDNTDITERRQIETALARERELLQLLFDNMPVMVSMYEAETQSMRLNAEFERLIGWKSEEVTAGSLLKDLYPDPEYRNDVLQRMAAAGKNDWVDVKVVTREGHTLDSLWSNISIAKDGQLVTGIAIGIDITERKQMEEKLRVENERFSKFINSNIVGVIIADPTGRILLANDYYLHLLGVSRDDFEQGLVDWRKFTPPEWLYADEKAILELRETGVCEPYEKEYVRADGTRVPIYLADAMLPGPGEEIVAFVLDISERKRAERSLIEYARQQSALYQLAERLQHSHTFAEIYDAALDAILDALQCDRASILLFDETNHMRFVAWRGLSDVYRQKTDGHSPWNSEDRNVGPIWYENVNTADVSDELKATIKDEGIGSLAFIPLVPNGKLIGKFMVYFNTTHVFTETEIDLSQTIGRHLAFDVSRKRAEESLRVSEEKYRQIVETANEGIWEIDADARTLFVNARMANMLGYSVDEIIGHSVFEYVFPQDRLEGEKRLDHARTGSSARAAEFRYRRKDGSVLWTVASNTPRWGADGRLMGAFAMMTDITDRKLVQEALNKERELLKRLFDTMPVMLMIHDPVEELPQLNSYFKELIGWDEEGMTLQRLNEVCYPDPDYRAEVIRQLSACAENEWVDDIQMYTRDGRTLNTTWSNIRFANGMQVNIGIDMTERKRAEDALRSSEERMRLAIEANRMVAWEWDATSDQVTTSDNFAEIYGLSSVNKAAEGFSLIWPEDFPAHKEKVDRIMRDGGEYLSEFRITRPADGRVMWMEERASAMANDEEIIRLVGVVTDITERKKAEEELRASESLYRSIARNIPGGGVYIVNKDFRYIVAEGPVTEAFGLSREMLEGRTIFEVLKEEQARRMEERLKRNFAGEVLSYETHANGRVYWTQQAPLFDSLGQVIILTLDITARKQAEDRLALLAEVSELARNVDDPIELMSRVASLVGSHLHVKRCLFNEIDVGNDLEIVHHDYHDGVPSVAGRHKITDYSSITSQEIMQGKTIVNHDSKTDPRTAADYERSYAPNGERAYVAVPLMRDERWVASLWVSDDAPRAWDKDDVSLIETIAERTWVATERMRINAELRDSEELLRVTFNTTAVGFAILRPDTHFEEINDAFCEIVGYSREELLQMSCNSLTHEDYLSETTKHVAQLLSGELSSFVMEKIYIRKDGAQIWVQNNVSVMRDAEGKALHLIAICQDITRRKENEEELRRLNIELEDRVEKRTLQLKTAGQLRRMEMVERRHAEDRFAKSFNASPTAMSITRFEDGQYRNVNPKFVELLGYELDEIIGHTSLDLHLYESAEERSEIMRSVRANNGRWSYETRLQTKLGDILEVNISVVEIELDGEAHVLSSIIDITERNRILAALRASEQQLRALFDVLPVGVSYIRPNGDVIEYNRTLEKILEIAHVELEKGSYKSRQYIRSDGTPMPASEFASSRALAEQRTIKNVETGIIKEGGTVIWTSVSATPISMPEPGAVVITVDVTERKHMDDELRRSHKRYQVLSQRLVEIQEEERRTISRELHDRVGQTLSALNLNLSFMDSQLSPESRTVVGSRLKDAIQLTEETVATIRDVMADLRPPALDDYGLEAALNAYADTFSRRSGIKVTLIKPRASIPRLNPAIELTLLRITQEALTNVSRHANANRVSVTLAMDYEMVYLTIEDNGAGIRSWQKANRPGSHGLKIMRERAEAFGGLLQVQSFSQKGTRIEVKIPIGDGKQPKIHVEAG